MTCCVFTQDHKGDYFLARGSDCHAATLLLLFYCIYLYVLQIIQLRYKILHS